ncbi:S49 family peptidase [Xanthomonas sp. MUS 060]|uniref:S49 family peptidase n=1 Tax=Xanthomonas sp. MUS 060 TaxID=1588031 RepID=UPI000697ED9D|nr:S49 family peptidase [Xanthomonas sp. MUS 060]
MHLLGAALRQALADDTVSQILIDIDSPGGSVYGVAELADQIQSARSIKPVVAVANSLAASAAYWIGCAAGELYVTPGGEVGSIGVWQAHFDYSQALAADGVTPTTSIVPAAASTVLPNWRTRSSRRARSNRSWQ